jgi:hypothetical protein
MKTRFISTALAYAAWAFFMALPQVMLIRERQQDMRSSVHQSRTLHTLPAERRAAPETRNLWKSGGSGTPASDVCEYLFQ